MQRRHLLFALCATAATGLAAAPVLANAPKKKGGGLGYTQFPMISVFTKGAGHRHGSMSVEIGLYCDDAKLTDQVKLYRPRLMDAYVTKLQGYAANLTAASLVDTDYIAVQLQATTDKILGRPGARVLLGSILLN
ncbi:hypothetical protein ABAC460_06335 [Asticcacaulis sp. AC460]|uniref:hypothetical protein n=1 Tax=Asticcacaulis sp. AC460 TaxID=1282360 RepID=UPI0003C3E060|nr:hypothetical protein [Asticcacaulis sp. AC460]ESQ91176.1 hypothetical protein ABAC460_06335 [Asticcacaulis sp. AC460]